MKKCIKCNVEKELNNFPKSKKHFDGFNNICKQCVNEYNKFYYYGKLKEYKQTHIFKKLIPERKVCKQCKIEKNLDEYFKKKSGRDGRQTICKSCKKEYFKLLRKEKINKYKNNPILIKIKVCLRCKTEKSIEQFNKNLEYKDLHSCYCKNCERNIKNKWKLDNIGKVNSSTAKRRAELLKRIPKWTTKEELKEIESFYKNCPKGMTIDHIIPLQGKTISGFHVLANLQYLSSKENSKKNNQFPYYPLEFYKSKGLI